MSAESLVAIVVSVAVLAYLVYTLIKPERF